MKITKLSPVFYQITTKDHNIAAKLPTVIINPAHADTILDIECNDNNPSPVSKALNIDLILLSIFSHTDFQTLKNCRLVRRSWKNCANLAIHQTGGSRTFVNPGNLGNMLNAVKKFKDEFSLLQSSDFVVERASDSRIFWAKLYRFFVLLGDVKPRVNSLTIIWPAGKHKEDDGPAGHVVQLFLQIVQQLSSSLEELNVTHYLMAHEPGRRLKKLMDTKLQLKLPACRSIKILPRFASDAEFHNYRQSLSSWSVGLFIVQSCPNLDRVDNLHLEEPNEWPKYIHLVKNYVFHTPLRVNKNRAALFNFSRAIPRPGKCRLESLSDSCYNFLYTPGSWMDREHWRLTMNEDETIVQDFLNIIEMSQDTLKVVKLRDFPNINIPSIIDDKGLPLFRNIQTLQLKIGKHRNIQHFFNPLNGNNGTQRDPLPSLKTISLALETGWQKWMKLRGNDSYDPKMVYRSVTSLEIRPECLEEGKLMGERENEHKLPGKWLEALQKFFPNIENVTILHALHLEYFLLAFLGPKSKFSLRSMTFNIHLGASTRKARYPNLDPVFYKAVSTPESIHGVLGLRKLDIIFENYWHDGYFSLPEKISPRALQVFLHHLSDIQVTFHYDHNQSPKGLLKWLRPLGSVSPRVRFQHLSREPFSRSAELEMYKLPIKHIINKNFRFTGHCIGGIVAGIFFLFYVIMANIK